MNGFLLPFVQHYQGQISKALPATQALHLKYDYATADGSASTVDKVTGGHEGAPGGQDIVDKHDTLTFELHALGWDLQRGFAVLQRVLLTDDGWRKLALLADSQNAHAHIKGHGGAQQETSRV